MFLMQGKSPPEEYALGSIVKLKEPRMTGLNPWHRWEDYGKCCCGFEFDSYSNALLVHLREKAFKWGIIIKHKNRTWRGRPRVNLLLYNDEGRLFMGRNNVPEYVDFAAGEFQVVRTAAE